MDDRLTKEAKLNATKEIVASYVRSMQGKEGEKTSVLTPDEVCQFFTKLYQTIDDTIPEVEKRRIGLGS